MSELVELDPFSIFQLQIDPYVSCVDDPIGFDLDGMTRLVMDAECEPIAMTNERFGGELVFLLNTAFDLHDACRSLLYGGSEESAKRALSEIARILHERPEAT